MKSLCAWMFVILFASLILPLSSAHAQNANGPTIFDVRRSLPLEPDEPVTKDFYINAGPESGLKKGVYVLVVRAVPVHDPIANKQQATLNIPVGKVQVIDVQRGITVARLTTELTDEERPTLEFEGVMIGDRLDLGSVTTDEPKKSKRTKKSAKVDEPKVEAPAAEAVAAVPVPAPQIAPAPVAVPVSAPAVVPGVVPAVVPASAIAPVQKSDANLPKTTQASPEQLGLDT